MADDDPSDPVAEAPSAELDRLYDLGADEFVAARDRLAGELRRAGDRAGADAVRKLRRPTVVAWGLNQLARRHPDRIAELVELGRAAAGAQREVMAGEAARFRELDRQRRHAVGELVELAGDVLGRSRTHLDEVEASLQAASLDPDGAGEALAAGRLSAAIPPASGFELALAGWSAGAAAPSPSPAMGDKAPAAGAVEAREQRAQQRRRARDDARRRADEAARAAEEAEARAHDLDRQVTELQARASEARREAVEARRHAEEARRTLGRAEFDAPDP